MAIRLGDILCRDHLGDGMKPMRGVAPKNPLTNWPYYASCKIDGLRAVVRDGTVYSKTLKPIPNKQVQRTFGHLDGADGELVVGLPYREGPEDDVYDRSRGILMTAGAIPNADIRFMIFDIWNLPDLEFQYRAEAQDEYLSEVLHAPGVYVVEQKLIHNQDALDAYEAWALGRGYEGVMLRRPDGLYKYGQSTEKEGYLLKIKRFKDSEAIILEVFEQMENTNEATTNELGYTKRSSAQAGKVGKGTFGSFLVRDIHTGVEFYVGNGPGLTAVKRDDLWQRREDLPGQYIVYTYQEIGTTNAPRLPQLKGFRPDWDIVGLRR